MTDPLKLPLRIGTTGFNGILILDADNRTIEMTDHRAAVIVAALEADDEIQESYAACAYEHGTDECIGCGWWPDAEQEVQGER